MSFPLRTRTRGRPSRNAGVVNVAVAHEFDALGLITWDLGAWYAEDPDWTNPGNGGLVDQLDDGGSGTARHMTASTTARPTYNSSVAAFNNKPALTSDGGDFLSTGAFTAFTAPYSLVIIGKFGTTASTQGLIGRGTTGTPNVHFFLNSGDTTFRAYADGGANVITGPAANTNVHLFRIYVVVGSNAGKLEVDGSATSGTLSTTTVGLPTTLGLFGASGGSSLAASGSAIAFAGAYAGDVSAAPGWAAFKAAAATHYGLTIA